MRPRRRRAGGEGRSLVGLSGLRVSLLNGFRLCRNREVITLPPCAQRLVAFVALHDRPLTRHHVAGTLWPDTPERRSNASLRSALWRVSEPARELVRSSRRDVQLDPAVSVDVREASAAARHLFADRAADDIGISAELLEPGDLLMGWYEDWVILERERFRQLRLRALELLCQRLTEEGRYAEAVQAGSAAVMTEPLRETARRVVIQACLAEGNYAEALQQYRSYRRALHDELGLEPSPTIKALIATLPSSKAG